MLNSNGLIEAIHRPQVYECLVLLPTGEVNIASKRSGDLISVRMTNVISSITISQCAFIREGAVS